jgi:hypothetical protein
MDLLFSVTEEKSLPVTEEKSLPRPPNYVDINDAA